MHCAKAAKTPSAKKKDEWGLNGRWARTSDSIGECFFCLGVLGAFWVLRVPEREIRFA
jgi:hypothetical protein